MNHHYNMGNMNSMGNMDNRNDMGNMNDRNDMGDMGDRNSMGNMSDRNDMGNMGDRDSMGNMNNRNNMGNMNNRNNMGNMGDRNNMGNMNNRNDMGNMSDRNDMGNMGDRNDMGNMGDRNSMGNMNNRNDMGNMGDRNSMGNMNNRNNMGNMRNSNMFPCGDSDNGPNPYAANICQLAARNQNFRTTIWTGCNLQMTLMCIPVNDDIGSEVHEDNDQFIRVEQGNAMVRMRNCEMQGEFIQRLSPGDGVFVPAGTRHNIINIGRMPLKLSSIYAPPHHKRGTIHRTKQDAANEEY